jgi:hypothetical protein
MFGRPTGFKSTHRMDVILFRKNSGSGWRFRQLRIASAFRLFLFLLRSNSFFFNKVEWETFKSLGIINLTKGRYPLWLLGCGVIFWQISCVWPLADFKIPQSKRETP